jgi:hypothetical protein
MARIVRVIEYLGTENQLKAWLEHSCADGVSPMFGPERQMTIWTIESDVPEIPVAPAPNPDVWDARTAVSFAGKGRPPVKYEDFNNRGPWRMELTALQALIGTHLKTLPSSYEVTAEDNIALHRVLSRVNAVLAEGVDG